VQVPAPAASVVPDPASVVLVLVAVGVAIPVAVAAVALAPAPVAGFAAGLLVVAREFAVLLTGHQLLLVVQVFLRSAAPR
jgi:hypothetical protein